MPDRTKKFRLILRILFHDPSFYLAIYAMCGLSLVGFGGYVCSLIWSDSKIDSDFWGPAVLSSFLISPFAAWRLWQVHSVLTAGILVDATVVRISKGIHGLKKAHIEFDYDGKRRQTALAIWGHREPPPNLRLAVSQSNPNRFVMVPPYG